MRENNRYEFSLQNLIEILKGIKIWPFQNLQFEYFLKISLEINSTQPFDIQHSICDFIFIFTLFVSAFHGGQKIFFLNNDISKLFRLGVVKRYIWLLQKSKSFLYLVFQKFSWNIFHRCIHNKKRGKGKNVQVWVGVSKEPKPHALKG